MWSNDFDRGFATGKATAHAENAALKTEVERLKATHQTWCDHWDGKHTIRQFGCTHCRLAAETERAERAEALLAKCVGALEVQPNDDCGKYADGDHRTCISTGHDFELMCPPCQRKAALAAAKEGKPREHDPHCGYYVMGDTPDEDECICSLTAVKEKKP